MTEDLVTRYFDGSFFDELGRGASIAERSTSASLEISELHDVSLTPALTRYVDFLATHERDERFGAVGWFGATGGTTVDWLPGQANAFAHALAEPFRLPAALAGGLPLGCDHGGNVWIVSLSSAGSEVFFVDSDEDEPWLFSDSIEAFAFAMGILERGGSPTATERDALQGRLFTSARALESFASLPSAPIESRSRLDERYRAHRDLVSAFAGGDVPEGRPGETVSVTTAAGDAAAHLLRLHLRHDRAALTSTMQICAHHPARFVRDAVAWCQRELAAS